MAEHYDVSGKVVLITGAARGIGAEAARQLYAKGAQVSLVGIEPELLEQRVSELGPRAAWFEADVTDTDALGRAVDATVERFGGTNPRSDFGETNPRVQFGETNPRCSTRCR